MYLSEIIEVVSVIHPAKRWPFADTVGFVDDVMGVTSLAVVQHALEELTTNINKSSDEHDDDFITECSTEHMNMTHLPIITTGLT